MQCFDLVRLDVCLTLWSLLRFDYVGISGDLFVPGLSVGL